MQALAGMVAMVIILVLLYQLPPIKNRLAWRFDAAFTAVRMGLRPAGAMPTAVRAQGETIGQTQAVEAIAVGPTSSATAGTPSPTSEPDEAFTATLPAETATPEPTATATATPTPLAAQVRLKAPAYESQDWNNCGPATMALYLKYYEWAGTQFDISKVIKVNRDDRNVNIDELTDYVHANIPDLYSLYRVDGTVDMIRQFLAEGIPVMIEEAFILDQSYWFEDDRWSGHYLLVTGYSDDGLAFTAQDTFLGPNRIIPYKDLDKNWQAFNRAFILVYRPDQEGIVQSILADDWDINQNRQNALETAEEETQSDPDNAFTWFNLGTNLSFFERYDESANAYDKARELGLPQRMLRYQFGPFLAYFHAGRNPDLMALADYALEITPNSEEALLWRGWALFRDGNTPEAYGSFLQALEERPTYGDAQYAIGYIGGK